MKERPAHHPTASPSSLPGKKLCPCYVSGPAGEAAHRGTLQHSALEELFAADEFQGSPTWDLLTEEEQGFVNYALDVYKTYTGQSREVEVPLNLVEDFEELTYGTADVIYLDGPRVNVFDYKSGRKRDYSAQVDCYARMAMQKYGVTLAQVWLVYGRLGKYERRVVSYEETDYIVDLIGSITDELSHANPCQYCDWCERRDECPALLNTAVTVANGYQDALNFSDWHPSQMDNPVQVAMGLHLASILEKWAKSMKHHGETKIRKGMRVPGWGMVQKTGNRRWIKEADANTIWAASKLPAEEFLPACKVTLGPIEKAIAASLGYKGTGSKAVKKEISKRFGALLERPESESLTEVDLDEQQKAWIEEDLGTPVDVIDTECGEIVEKEEDENDGTEE